MLVLQNMDELMELPLSAAPDSARLFAAAFACTCNPCALAHYPPDWTPANCAYTPGAAGLGILNGGLQVVVPSTRLYAEILATIATPQRTEAYAFADQSLLSDTFGGRWVPIGYEYNALKTLRWCHKDVWRDQDVKNIHYILSPKPWENRDSDEETHAWWWAANDARLAKEEKLGIVRDGW